MLSTQVLRSFYSFNTPKNTPRLTLSDGSRLIYRSQPIQPLQESLHPPLVNAYDKKKHVLTGDEIKEIKSLRSSNPQVWTVSKLSQKFNTYPYRITQLASCPKSRRESLSKEAQEQFDQLSPKRKRRLIDRVLRKDQWLQ